MIVYICKIVNFPYSSVQDLYDWWLGFQPLWRLLIKIAEVFFSIKVQRLQKICQCLEWKRRFFS